MEVHPPGIRSKDCLKMHVQVYFQNKEYIPLLFIAQFSPRESNCVEEIIVGVCNGPFFGETNVMKCKTIEALISGIGVGYYVFGDDN